MNAIPKYIPSIIPVPVAPNVAIAEFWISPKISWIVRMALGLVLATICTFGTVHAAEGKASVLVSATVLSTCRIGMDAGETMSVSCNKGSAATVRMGHAPKASGTPALRDKAAITEQKVVLGASTVTVIY